MIDLRKHIFHRNGCYGSQIRAQFSNKTGFIFKHMLNTLKGFDLNGNKSKLGLNYFHSFVKDIWLYINENYSI